jgi:hypothetical protein
VRLIKILAPGAGALCLLSCGAFGPRAHVDVLIPAPPAHWTRAFPDLQFCLVIPDSPGKEQTVWVTDPGQPVAIDCPKTGNTPILAYPVSAKDRNGGTGPAGMLRPAGGIYPGSLIESSPRPTLVLDWRDGAAAAVLSRLLSAGRDTSLINAARLVRYFRDAEDPWKLDLEQIEGKLAAGKLTAYDIDELPCRNVEVKVGTGDWFMETPFSAVATVNGEGTLGLAGVSLGMHGLFSVGGRLFVIDVGSVGTTVLPVR